MDYYFNYQWEHRHLSLRLPTRRKWMLRPQCFNLRLDKFICYFTPLKFVINPRSPPCSSDDSDSDSLNSSPSFFSLSPSLSSSSSSCLLVPPENPPSPSISFSSFYIHAIYTYLQLLPKECLRMGAIIIVWVPIPASKIINWHLWLRGSVRLVTNGAFHALHLSQAKLSYKFLPF